MIEKKKYFKKFEDIILVSAMGPPGERRSNFTARMPRHFNMFTYTNLQESSIKQIFATIVKTFLGKFKPKVVDRLDKIVDMTLKICNNETTELKPTPKNSHYTFNI